MRRNQLARGKSAASESHGWTRGRRRSSWNWRRDLAQLPRAQESTETPLLLPSQCYSMCIFPMQSRRNFIGKVATGLAGTLAASNVLGANDHVRVGLIGCGA